MPTNNPEEPKDFNTYEAFLLFLYLHIASADYKVQASEIDVILNKIQYMFSEDTDLVKMFISQKDQYDRMSNEVIDETIRRNLHTYCENQQKADRIFSDLFEIITADGLIHETETQAIEQIRRLMPFVQ